MHYGVVGCNDILVLLGIEGGDKDCVGVAMVGSQYALVTTAISDMEASSVVCVKLGCRLGPNVNLVRSYAWKGIRRGCCWIFGRIFGLGFGGADTFPSLGNIALDGFFGGRAVLVGVNVG